MPMWVQIPPPVLSGEIIIMLDTYKKERDEILSRLEKNGGEFCLGEMVILFNDLLDYCSSCIEGLDIIE